MRPHLDFAKLIWDQEGYPHSALFDDRYYLDSYGLEETYYVYLRNGALAERFQELPVTVIGEVGFGSGLNFLAALKLFEATAPCTHSIVYIACERHPLSPVDLKQSLLPWQHQLPHTSLFLDAYHTLAPGLNIFTFLENKAVLILLIGEAQEQLKQYDFLAHHWILDGFAPAKNPDAWREELLEVIAMHCAPLSSLSTFTAAGVVNRGLQAQGWEVQKLKGFGKKRHRLEATYVGQPSPTWVESQEESDPSLTIVGDGIAAQSLHFFMQWLSPSRFHINRVNPHPLSASGLPWVSIKPSLRQSLDGACLLGMRSHLLAIHFYKQWSKLYGLSLSPLTTLFTPREHEHKKYEAIAQNPLMSPLLRYEDGKISYPLGIEFDAQELLAQMSLVTGKARSVDVVPLGPNVVIACTFASQQYCPSLPTPSMLRGQLGGQYTHNDLIWTHGPTFERYDYQPTPKDYGWPPQVKEHVIGFRAMSPDYLPQVGQDPETLRWYNTYHGTRGFTTSLWSGVLLALNLLGIFRVTPTAKESSQ